MVLHEEKSEQVVMAKRNPIKNPHAVALGKLGGVKGGPVRAAHLTKVQREVIASKGGKAEAAKHAGHATKKKGTSK